MYKTLSKRIQAGRDGRSNQTSSKKSRSAVLKAKTRQAKMLSEIGRSKAIDRSAFYKALKHAQLQKAGDLTSIGLPDWLEAEVASFGLSRWLRYFDSNGRRRPKGRILATVSKPSS